MNCARFCITGAITAVFIAGCGVSSDAFTPVNDQYPTTLTLTATSATIGGPLTVDSVTADLVTIEPSGTDTFTPERATISGDNWTYQIKESGTTPLTNKAVEVRWFKGGLQIAYRKVTVTAK